MHSIRSHDSTFFRKKLDIILVVDLWIQQLQAFFNRIMAADGVEHFDKSVKLLLIGDSGKFKKISPSFSFFKHSCVHSFFFVRKKKKKCPLTRRLRAHLLFFTFEKKACSSHILKSNISWHTHTHTYKLKTGVGKTAIMLQFADSTFSDTFITTVGIDYKYKWKRN